ncbi:hypothetical protein H4Q26_001495 [Puccinia striiformis f. sp. tritici PST-130]|nr:hypothetical protein H4Q26_001495 [Puccinia striiformis f. sp. tritici PST-130]
MPPIKIATVDHYSRKAGDPGIRSERLAVSKLREIDYNFNVISRPSLTDDRREELTPGAP